MVGTQPMPSPGGAVVANTGLMQCGLEAPKPLSEKADRLLRPIKAAGKGPPPQPWRQLRKSSPSSPPPVLTHSNFCVPALSLSHPRHPSLPTRRWTTFRWIRRRPRPCRAPCKSGRTCGSPPSLPRGPSCDAQATKPGEGPGGTKAASSLSPLSPLPSPLPPNPLHSATLAFNTLDIRDPELFPWEVRA